MLPYDLCYGGYDFRRSYGLCMHQPLRPLLASNTCLQLQLTDDDTNLLLVLRTTSDMRYTCIQTVTV